MGLATVVEGRRNLGVAQSATGVDFYSFLAFAVAAFAQLAVGYLADRFPLRYIFAAISLAMAIFFTLMIGLTGLPALVVSFGFMLVVFGEIPITDVLIGRFASREWRGRAYSASYVIGFTVSALAVPLIAWIHGARGFDYPLGLLATCAIRIFFAALLLPAREHPRVEVQA